MLPTYPFQRKHFWGPAKPQAHQVERDSTHPLLGGHRSLAGVAGEKRYDSTVAPDRPRWMDDHRVMGDIVFPGAGYVEMALAASPANRNFRDVTFATPLRLSTAANLQTVRALFRCLSSTDKTLFAWSQLKVELLRKRTISSEG